MFLHFICGCTYDTSGIKTFLAPKKEWSTTVAWTSFPVWLFAQQHGRCGALLPPRERVGSCTFNFWHMIIVRNHV